MRGCIVTRPGKGKVRGKPQPCYYLVLRVNGKQKWEAVPPPRTRKHAEQLLAERLSELNSGEYLEPKRITFAEFQKVWLKKYAEGQIRPSTLATFDGFFKNHLVPAFGSKQLSAITVEDVQGFKTQKLRAGYRRG